MLDDDEKPSGGEETGAERKGRESFRIRAFADLRAIRRKHLRESEDCFISDHPNADRLDNDEEDFGLKRSTIEEALKFLRENIESGNEDGDDGMTEFLHDD